MAAPVIETEGLTKRYGKHLGIEDVDFEVAGGEVFGFLGPNGAGKTTTIRTLLDLIRPTRGWASLFGLDSRRDGVEIRSRLGYVPGELALYERLTGEDVLEFLAHLRGGVDRNRIRELADRLGAQMDKRIRALSHGNKQKVGLIQAFMHRPELLVLDEPTQGLDPLVQNEVHRLIREARAEGRTVLLSSHDLTEVEALCDRVGIIRAGHLGTVEEVAALKARALRRLEIHFAQPVPAEAFSRLPGVQNVEAIDSMIRCTVVGTLDPLIKAAAAHTVVNLISEEPSLEEIFLAYYGETEA
jgi:ABC-2 type transport system ATP-binding protein